MREYRNRGNNSRKGRREQRPSWRHRGCVLVAIFSSMVFQVAFLSMASIDEWLSSASFHRRRFSSQYENNLTHFLLETISPSRSRNSAPDSPSVDRPLHFDATEFAATPPTVNRSLARSLSNSRANSSLSDYAYVFVADCQTQLNRNSGFLYNVLVGATLLGSNSSSAIETILLIPSGDKCHSLVDTTILQWLQAVHVEIRYYDSSCDPAIAVLEPLGAALSLQQEFQKMIVLDAHRVTPLTNLEFMFEIPAMQEYLVFATSEQPVYTGLFMMTSSPSTKSDFSRYQTLVERRKTEPWDVVMGWGVRISSPDHAWKTRKEMILQRGNRTAIHFSTGQNWTFPCASSDAGLCKCFRRRFVKDIFSSIFLSCSYCCPVSVSVYHWAMYEKKSVSIVFGKTMQNWKKGANGAVTLVEEIDHPFEDQSRVIGFLKPYKACRQVLCQVQTFPGKSQPWRTFPTKQQLEPIVKPSKDVLRLWWSTLRGLDETLNLELRGSDWRPLLSPAVDRGFDFHSLHQSAHSVLNHSVVYPSRVYNTQSPYACTFVIGGCDPRTNGYKGYIYNILVAARLLQELGSTADVVAIFQMKNDLEAEELPYEDVRLLTALKVQIYYIPKSTTECFYDTVLNKFRVLALTQYRRVILMDGDVIPVRNLDWLFQLSDPEYQNQTRSNDTTLYENVIVSGRQEPANGGFFMLAPEKGDYQRLQDILKIRVERAEKIRNQSDKFVFDEVNGWGHAIKSPDRWTTRNPELFGTNWTFHFAYSDQGLRKYWKLHHEPLQLLYSHMRFVASSQVYHWTKYVKKSVSIVFGQYVENWSAMPNGTVSLQNMLGEKFFNMSTPGILSNQKPCKKFMCDFVHFSGRGKPWFLQPLPALLKSRGDGKQHKSMQRLWWVTLKELDYEFDMGLNFTHWPLVGMRPDHGFWASRKQVDMHNRVSRNAL